MTFMRLPVFDINLCQGLILDDQHILGILFFSGLREIEAPRDHHAPVDDHDLVVGNGMLVVNECRDPGVRQEGGRGIFF